MKLNLNILQTLKIMPFLFSLFKFHSFIFLYINKNSIFSALDITVIHKSLLVCLLK